MAKESSFDIVSTVDLQEVDNAYQQAVREIAQRYDLKDSHATLEFNKGDASFVLSAPADFVATQVIDVLNTKLTKRGVDLKALHWDDPQPATGSSLRVFGHLIEGIDKESAKRISKDIRDKKMKAKVTIEGDKLRVTSASRDVLQAIIAFLSDRDYGQPLQYVNYR